MPSGSAGLAGDTAAMVAASLDLQLPPPEGSVPCLLNSGPLNQWGVEAAASHLPSLAPDSGYHAWSGRGACGAWCRAESWGWDLETPWEASTRLCATGLLPVPVRLWRNLSCGSQILVWGGAQVRSVEQEARSASSPPTPYPSMLPMAPNPKMVLTNPPQFTGSCLGLKEAPVLPTQLADHYLIFPFLQSRPWKWGRQHMGNGEIGDTGRCQTCQVGIRGQALAVTGYLKCGSVGCVCMLWTVPASGCLLGRLSTKGPRGPASPSQPLPAQFGWSATCCTCRGGAAHLEAAVA